MGFFKKIGKAFKKVGKGVVKVVKGVGNVAAATGIPIISQAGKLVSSIIPDKVVSSIEKAVQRDGVVKVNEIEKTVQNYVPAADVELVTRSVTTAIAETTSATIDDSTSSVNVPLMEKVKQYIKKPITWVCVAGVGVVIYILCGKKGKKKKW